MISVVIPTYNRKDSLRRTLDGLAGQTYPATEFEVVVISDGSTDGTDPMLAAYAVSAAYTLRAVTQPNSGPAVARNRGVREARHEVIVFLDDDVEPVPDFLARHAAHHDGSDKVVVIGPMSPDPARHAEEPAWIAWEHAKLQDTYRMFRPGGRFAQADAGAEHFYSGNVSLRRCWLLEVGGFDERFKRQEDVELAMRLAHTCGLRFVFDFTADGLHRPTRTFQSWLRIPQAYGRLDAQRVQAGQITDTDISNEAQRRNRATRALTRFCLAAPALLPILDALGRLLAVMLHRLRRERAALAVLSGLYNARYAEAFHRAMRSAPRPRRASRSEAVTL